MTHFFAPLGIFPPMSPSHGCQVFVTHFFVSLRSFQLCCRHTAVIRPRLSSFGANFFASLRFSTNLPLHSCQVSVPTFFAPLRIIPNMLPSHGRHMTAMRFWVATGSQHCLRGFKSAHIGTCVDYRTVFHNFVTAKNLRRVKDCV